MVKGSIQNKMDHLQWKVCVLCVTWQISWMIIKNHIAEHLFIPLPEAICLPSSSIDMKDIKHIAKGECCFMKILLHPLSFLYLPSPSFQALLPPRNCLDFSLFLSPPSFYTPSHFLLFSIPLALPILSLHQFLVAFGSFLLIFMLVLFSNERASLRMITRIMRGCWKPRIKSHVCLAATIQ